MVLKLAGEAVDQPLEWARPHAPRKIHPLAVRSADLLALKASREARSPPKNALAGITSENRAVENRTAKSHQHSAVDPAAQRRVN
jgi:hypothetical protein